GGAASSKEAAAAAEPTVAVATQTIEATSDRARPIFRRPPRGLGPEPLAGDVASVSERPDLHVVGFARCGGQRRVRREPLAVQRVPAMPGRAIPEPVAPDEPVLGQRPHLHVSGLARGCRQSRALPELFAVEAVPAMPRGAIP